jgi:hypothetical protein
MFGLRKLATGPAIRLTMAAAAVVAGMAVSLPSTARAGPQHKYGFADYDDDGRTDTAVFRPSTGDWYVVNSSSGHLWSSPLGAKGDWPVPGDYDGDGRADLANWRAANGVWSIRRSSTGALFTYTWGGGDDVPVPGDYDGDGRTDIAIWRPSNGVWWIVNSSTGTGWTRQWGLEGDWPVAGDYDGDGRTDTAVWRPSNGTWHIVNSTTGTRWSRQWGLVGDWPVAGDYDGDGRTDTAVWRPKDGRWYVILSAGGGLSYRWGEPGDQPVPGDYDGDGRTDIAIWRPSNGMWWIVNSSTGTGWTRQWGLTNDLPVANTQQFVPKVQLQSLDLGGTDVALLNSGSESADVPWGRTLRVLVQGNPRANVTTSDSTSTTCNNFNGSATTSQPLVSPQPGNPLLITRTPNRCFYTASITAHSNIGVPNDVVGAKFSYSPIVIDKTVSVPEASAVVDTGIDLLPGDGIMIDASGSIWAGVWGTGSNGPDGWVGWSGAGKPLTSAAPFSLIGSIGSGGLFFVGNTFESAPSLAGTSRLFLRTNDDVPGNGSGAFTVRVRVYR